MTYVIYKYPLALEEMQLIKIYNGRILNIVKQNDIAVMYVLIDKADLNDDLPKYSIKVIMVGTGNDLDDGVAEDYHYMNTLQFGTFMFHYFVDY